MILSDFRKITIEERVVILKYHNKESKEISFLDINKIYLKTKKIPRIYIVFLWDCSKVLFGFRVD